MVAAAVATAGLHMAGLLSPAAEAVAAMVSATAGAEVEEQAWTVSAVAGEVAVRAGHLGRSVPDLAEDSVAAVAAVVPEPGIVVVLSSAIAAKAAAVAMAPVTAVVVLLPAAVRVTRDAERKCLAAEETVAGVFVAVERLAGVMVGVLHMRSGLAAAVAAAFAAVPVWAGRALVVETPDAVPAEARVAAGADDAAEPVRMFFPPI